jgi:hypothetical protein
MPIESKNLFGNKNNNAAETSNKKDRPKAQFWLNVGLVKEVNGDEVFLSLPLGIPLDTQDALDTRSSNKEFAMMQAARNSIVEQLKEYAETMSPGEDVLIDLKVQLRRVKETTEVSTKPDENPFAINMKLVEKAA